MVDDEILCSRAIFLNLYTNCFFIYKLLRVDQVCIFIRHFSLQSIIKGLFRNLFTKLVKIFKLIQLNLVADFGSVSRVHFDGYGRCQKGLL